MGAKFSSGGGATVFYDDGPITAPSGEQGTQRTEFEAAIKSVTSSTTVGAVFIYDTRNDSDGGAWRKKTQGLSWYDEDLNTATRGGRREFPSVALIVADNATDETLTIYDLDDPAMPVWMVFNVGGSYPAQYMLGETAWGNIHSVYALNGRLYVARNVAGVVEIDFANDHASRYSTDGQHRYGSIANRNADSDDIIRDSSAAIVHGTVNDVAATIVEGAEIGALGLPIPTVAVATAGGVSVIHPNGDVYDIAGTGQTHDDIQQVFFTDDGMVGYGYEASSSVTTAWSIGLRKMPFADGTIGGYASSSHLERYNPIVNGNASGLITNTNEYTSSNATVNAVTPTGKNGLAIGYGDRLSIVKRNTGYMEEGAVAYITSSYNTGYMLGDIKGAWLTGGDASADGRYDRSVGNTDLVENGTVLHAAAETDAEVTKYYDFSSSNYFSQAHNSDFDFTGDFSVTLWFKDATTSDPFVTRLENSQSAGKGFVISTTSGGLVSFAIYTTGFQSSGRTQVISGSAFTGSLGWRQLVATRRNGTMYLYIDGVSQGTPQSQSTDLTDSDAPLGVGIDYALGTGFGGSLSLVRISATAPTPQQVKEIYEAEKPLFQAGAKCLLQSDIDANTVNDLSYDKTTDLLHVFQNGEEVAETQFKGLEAVNTFGGSNHGWQYSSVAMGSAAGGVVSSARTLGAPGGVIVDLPAIDVRGDINIADTKLPDDGKLHFSGVTTDATPTVIGNIPIAANEDYLVRVAINGKRYQVHQSSWRIDGSIEQRFYRRIGGDNIEYTGETVKLTHEGQSSLDFDLNANTSNNCIEVKVTGAGTHNMQWNATVEVQRISEKTYER